jgi:hypothetical protein
VRIQAVIQESITNLNVTGEIPLATTPAKIRPGIAANRKQHVTYRPYSGTTDQDTFFVT